MAELTGVERIAAERQRQIERWGATSEHDVAHRDGQLARAAARYALPPAVRDVTILSTTVGRFVWPGTGYARWEFHPGERLRELEKAGALIAAEIDRLLADEPVQSEEG